MIVEHYKPNIDIVGKKIEREREREREIHVKLSKAISSFHYSHHTLIIDS